MRYGILGPLEVTCTGRTVTPSTPQQRTVLALLLANAGSWVSLSTIVDELWPEHTPRSARVIVQVAVSKLRKVLPADAIRTGPSGYLLTLDGCEFDQSEFVAEARRGRELMGAGRLAQARELLAAALGRWRGDALRDVVCGPVLAAHARWLEELRLSTVDSKVRIDLAAGRCHEVIAELTVLLARDPGQEALAGSLMVALHQAGRAAEAAEVFDQVAAHIEADPGPALRKLVTDPSVWELPRTVIRTAQLPPPVPDFVGRDDIGCRGPLTVLCGPSGVGKTALAVRIGHDRRAEFPDGQLYAQLRGVETAEVLGSFLSSLGCEVPYGLLERQQLFRSVTADRRILVVLDDAACEAQVRPLLPGGVGCAVLVTSRSRLSGLEGAAVAEVVELSEAESLALLSAVAGADRVAAEAESARELVRLCGHLPLAVRVAGAKLASTKYLLLRELVERIADERRRLAELKVGDLDVRAGVEVGYRSCDPLQRKLLRLLGWFDSVDLPEWAMTTLLDTDASAALAGLVEAQLVAVVGRDRLGQLRYRPHELIRVFGYERLLAEEPSRVEALDRLFMSYLDISARADRKLPVGRFPIAPVEKVADPAVVRRAEADPLAWRDAEAGMLHCLVRLAHRLGRWALAGRLAEVCAARPGDRRTEVIGLVSARNTGDRRAQAVSLCRLGDLHWEAHGRANRARVYYDMACRIFSRLDDRSGLGRALAARADIDVERGDIERAQVALQDGLAMLRQVGDHPGQADVLRQLGALLADRGRPAEATRCFEDSLQLARGLHDRRREAYAGKQLADVLRRNGEHDRAGELLEAALAASVRLADRHWEAHVLRSLGELSDAEDKLTRSLEMFRESGHEHASGYALRSLGEWHRRRGQDDRADALLTASLAVFEGIDDRRGRAYALLGLGQLRHRAGDATGGRRAVRESMRLFAGLGFTGWQAEARRTLRRLATV
ncbi:AfsR/SARP family transcriptional regulator [Kutzneria kofuensis]|uniref:DNA-binding SARP family transcriptional activator/tetratricopeptide (TPR) repeat protein n=1 Tax=Kutzneria kofuensis TaxID=103725 RepID=A0A7W9KDG5_9PSEU|nr:BTAD domain-containing putative transcriptional regulator [Kutzneria kofuensis]MBB5890578.1 DNA-binding SARP family transcriptional activator/tetratricopeptide (TPR) repeat protein [Kutzneria kofuensis]